METPFPQGEQHFLMPVLCFRSRIMRELERIVYLSHIPSALLHDLQAERVQSGTIPLTEDAGGIRITVAGMLAEGFTEQRSCRQVSTRWLFSAPLFLQSRRQLRYYRLLLVQRRRHIEVVRRRLSFGSSVARGYCAIN